MTLPPKLEKLLENWPAKIISLIAAILVYAFYQVSSLDTRYLVVPLEVREGAGMICTDISESSIKVAIRGAITDINTIEAKDFKAFVDMGRYMDEGKSFAPVQLDLSDNVRIMKDIEIKLEPETIEVTIEKELAEYIPVNLNYAGGAAHGYEIVSIKAKPSHIRVRGPGSLVDKLSVMETDEILLDELNQNVVFETELREINDQIIIDHEGPVSVEVTVEPSQMKRELDDLPITVYPAKGNLITEVAREKATLTITGNELDVEKYNPPVNFVFADCSRILESGEYDIPVQYSKSSKFTVESLYPATIHVTITEIPVEEEIEEEFEEIEE